MENTTKYKGQRVIYRKGMQFQSAELVWIGGRPGRSYTPEQQYLINKIIGIRMKIRKQAQQAEDNKFMYYQQRMIKEYNLVGSLIDTAAHNLVEKAYQRKHQLQAEEAKKIGIIPVKVPMGVINKRIGRVVVALND